MCRFISLAWIACCIFISTPPETENILRKDKSVQSRGIDLANLANFHLLKECIIPTEFSVEKKSDFEGTCL